MHPCSNGCVAVKEGCTFAFLKITSFNYPEDKIKITVIEDLPTSTENYLDLTNFPTGVYFASVNTGGAWQAQKVVKE
jgi:hypothetical protein